MSNNLNFKVMKANSMTEAVANRVEALVKANKGKMMNEMLSHFADDTPLLLNFFLEVGTAGSAAVTMYGQMVDVFLMSGTMRPCPNIAEYIASGFDIYASWEVCYTEACRIWDKEHPGWRD